MLFVFHPKLLHKHCLQFLLGVKMASREAKNNAYAKFWGDKQRALWNVVLFSGAVNIGGGGAASLRHRNRYRFHFAAHAPPKDRHGGLFTPHRKLAQSLSLTMRPTKRARLLWKFSPLGIFWAFLAKVFKIRLHVIYMRSKDCDGSRFFGGAFIGGNNFVFNPEANSLLFREFLPWLKQHQCMMPRKLRKSNNSLMFITDHDENSFDQQQQTINYKQNYKL